MLLAIAFEWGVVLRVGLCEDAMIVRFSCTRWCVLRFDNIRLAAIGTEIPDEICSSDDIERRLSPLYERLKLPPGRLEMMSGIVERRMWPVGTVPSTPSIRSGRAAIEASGIDRQRIGCLIHASVCRDFLEPATASRVHHELGLPSSAWVYDVSNACLGLVNGVTQIATLIQTGAIEAGLVVGTENARMLMDQTISHLNGDHSLTRKSVKPAFASLTIGSGSAAILVAREDLVDDGDALVAATCLAKTQHHDLCRSETDGAGASMTPLMDTDSERLMAEGIACGAENLQQLLLATNWDRAAVDRTVCHQVGGRHREAMLAAMELPIDRDTKTFDRLGNTGSVALPLTLGAAIRRGDLSRGDRVACLGIGSGINSVMLGLIRGGTPVMGNVH